MQLLPPPLRPRLPRARSKSPSTPPISLLRPSALGHEAQRLYPHPADIAFVRIAPPKALSPSLPPRPRPLPQIPLRSISSSPHSTLKSSPPPPPHFPSLKLPLSPSPSPHFSSLKLPLSPSPFAPLPFPQITSFPLPLRPTSLPSNYLFPPPLLPTPHPQIFPHSSPQRHVQRLGLTHNLSRAHSRLWIFGDIISYPREP